MIVEDRRKVKMKRGCHGDDQEAGDIDTFEDFFEDLTNSRP